MRSAPTSQGFTLGSLLFLFYIDLPNCLSKFNAGIFADDTTLFYSSNNPLNVHNTIHNEFQSLLGYCAANKLSVNFTKTNYMEIAPTHKPADKYTCNDTGKKPHIKYFGIYLDAGPVERNFECGAD